MVSLLLMDVTRLRLEQVYASSERLNNCNSLAFERKDVAAGVSHYLTILVVNIQSKKFLDVLRPQGDGLIVCECAVSLCQDLHASQSENFQLAKHATNPAKVKALLTGAPRPHVDWRYGNRHAGRYANHHTV